MITLDRLVNVLGNYGVRLRFSSVARSTKLRSVVMPEAGDGRDVVGDVLLALGAGSVKEAVRWAVSARAVVVLIRDEFDDEPFVDEVEGIAVMMVDPAVAWSDLAAVVYGLVLEGRETESGRGPTDLFALADHLADEIGAAVVIEDRLFRVLAYSRLQQHADPARVETILERQAPARLRTLFDARGVYQHVAYSDEPLFVDGDAEHGLTGRTVAAVRSGRELLGSVWVACESPLDAKARLALSDGARMVALHLLRSRASADLERQVESDLVLRLVEGTADAATVASRLGLPVSPLRLIALRARDDDERHAALLVIFERATTGFGWSRAGRSAVAGATVYTLLPADRASVARAWVMSLQSAIPTQMMLAAGISGVAGLTELPAARQEADECLALHELSGAGVVVPAYDESWADILLHRLRTAAGSGRVPARGPLSDLRHHDRTHSTQYVATLRAWLEAQGDLAQAGERLGVHENTIRNRLRKMAEVTTLDLQDARKRLAMMIDLAAGADE